MKSYENLDASWLRRDEWKMGVKHRRGKRERHERRTRKKACSEAERWMKGKRGREGVYRKRDTTPLEAPSSKCVTLQLLCEDVTT